MMAIPLPLTKRQLEEVVESYATVFHDWRIINRQVFVRTCGPIAQHVGFEALSSGAYRPWSGIGCLPLPSIRMLYQLLDIKHRQALLREHSAKWKSIVSAMEEQFRPAIRRPLELREVKGLCEQAARKSTNDLCMLAIVSAYLGDKEDAISYCDSMQELPSPTVAPRSDWEQAHKKFGRELRDAIERGCAGDFLDIATAAAPELM